MARLFKTVHEVAIGYKSGITRVTQCEDFTVTRGPDNDLTAVSWENIQRRAPDPLYIHPSAIESVWVVKVRKVFAPSLFLS